MKCFNYHTEKIPSHQPMPPKYERYPPQSSQALPVLSSTPIKLMSRANPHRRASTFNANRIRSRVFVFKTASSKKNASNSQNFRHVVLQGHLHRGRGRADKSLSHLAPTYSETYRFLKVLELCLNLPIQMLSSALKTSWVH